MHYNPFNEHTASFRVKDHVHLGWMEDDAVIIQFTDTNKYHIAVKNGLHAMGQGIYDRTIGKAEGYDDYWMSRTQYPETFVAMKDGDKWGMIHFEHDEESVAAPIVTWLSDPKYPSVEEALKDLHIVQTEEGYCIFERDLSTWDAQAWLREFAAAAAVRDTRPPRRKVYQSTLEIIRNGRYRSENGKAVQIHFTVNSRDQNMFVSQELQLDEVKERYDTLIDVLPDDCLVVAKRLRDEDATDDLCVLNLASRQRPGGGVFGGAGAQEEYLFRCSDYYRFIYQYANPMDFDSRDYGIKPNKEQHYPLDRNFGGIFSRGITIFRDTDAHGYALIDRPWKVNMVAVPAINLRGTYQRIPDDCIQGTRNKIRTILRLAYNNGQRRLVLGAFGCGAFHNPADHMAELFKDELTSDEFRGIFKQVLFAVMNTPNHPVDNYTPFKTILAPSTPSTK